MINDIELQMPIAEQIVALICNSDTVAEAFKIYRVFAPLLTEYKFVFAANSGGVPGFAVNRQFSAGAAVRSLFKTERILVLDVETMKEMEHGAATYRIDYSISLDTNAMSYLKPFMAGKRAAPIPADFQEVFEFIAQPDVRVDPLPYFFENLLKLANRKTADCIFENFKAYEVLRTLDTDWLSRQGEVRSILSEHEIVTVAQQRLSSMYIDSANAKAMQSLASMHQCVYAFLLKMTAIQLRTPSAALGKKMAAFLDFAHSTLATMSVRETAVARAYFQQGQNLKFFKKIQKKKKEEVSASLDQLRNMAWDLWHVRQLEQSMTLATEEGARYFFPAILTFDKGFIEIIDLYPLKACAFRTGSAKPMPFYDGDPFGLRTTDDDEGASRAKTYFAADAIAAREAARDRAKEGLSEIVNGLEDEFLRVATQ